MNDSIEWMKCMNFPFFPYFHNKNTSIHHDHTQTSQILSDIDLQKLFHRRRWFYFKFYFSYHIKIFTSWIKILLATIARNWWQCNFGSIATSSHAKLSSYSRFWFTPFSATETICAKTCRCSTIFSSTVRIDGDKSFPQ